MCQKKYKKKKIFNRIVSSHILCTSFVYKLPHECENITKNAWRTPLNAQCNIDYSILYFFKLPSKWIISLLFGELSNIDYFFTFLDIDSQPCPYSPVPISPNAHSPQVSIYSKFTSSSGSTSHSSGATFWFDPASICVGPIYPGPICPGSICPGAHLSGTRLSLVPNCPGPNHPGPIRPGAHLSETYLSAIHLPATHLPGTHLSGA